MACQIQAPQAPQNPCAYTTCQSLQSPQGVQLVQVQAPQAPQMPANAGSQCDAFSGSQRVVTNIVCVNNQLSVTTATWTFVNGLLTTIT